jgi:hypothetical protein
MVQCQSCGASMRLEAPIPRDAECEHCGHDVRSCRNCRHYDPAYNNACRETEAEPVADKLRRNFCEFFVFNPAPFAAAPGPDRSQTARQRLESLFDKSAAPPDATRTRPDSKAKGPEDSAARARRNLEGLFRPPPGRASQDPSDS